MDPNWFEQKVQHLDELVKVGQIGVARGELLQISASEIPRSFYLKFSDLYRRTALHYRALKLLAPLVRPKREFDTEASEEEMVSYAIHLTRIGASQEALSLLATIKGPKTAEANFARISALMLEWKYGSAIPLLRRYIKQVPMGGYTYWVGITNLIAALIAEDHFKEVDPLLENLIATTKEKNFSLLLQNAMLLKAQFQLLQDRPDQAMKSLAEGQKLNTESHRYSSVIKKWEIIAGLRSHFNANVTEQALEFRKRSLSQGLWENVRDMDRYLSIAQKDTNRFYLAYYGTPFLSFRRRLKEAWPLSFEPPEYVVIGESLKGIPLYMNELLYEDKLPSMLLRSLVRDLYQPIQIGRLFGLIYPMQYFDPVSSPHRISDVLGRLRTGFESRKMNLKVEVFRRSFRLLVQPPFLLHIPTKEMTRSASSKAPQWLRKLRSFGETPFRSREVASLLGLSKRTAERRLEAAIQLGFITRLESSSSTRYQLNLKALRFISGEVRSH